MADWDVNSPSDSDFIAQFPANERAARAALVANFGVDHEANAEDANIGKHVKVSLVDQSSDPAGAANSSTLYAKGVSGASQLFWRSGTGAVVQLTAAGGLRAESLVGTIADARLSSNVALLNAANVFTAQQTIQRTSAPTLTVERVGSAVNALIETKTTGGSVYFGNTNGSTFAIGDTAGLSSPWVTVSGTEFEVNANLLDFNGNADISGTLAVGGAATFSNNVTVGGTISGNGSSLTNLNASNLSSGTVPDARLSSNVPLLNADNVFSGMIALSNSQSAIPGSLPWPRLYRTTTGHPSTSVGDLVLLARNDAEDRGVAIFSGSAGSESMVARFATTTIALAATNITLNGAANISGTLAVGGAATFSNNVTVGGTISGNGSSLTNLNASNLSSGTVPSARLPATIGGNKTFSDNVAVGGTLTVSGTISGNGSGLTSLNASNLSSGTVSSDRLPSTIGGNKTFSDNVTINGAARAGTAATSTSATLAAGQIHHRSSNTTVPSMNAGQWVAVQNTSTSSITLSEGSGVTLELGGTTMTGNRTLLPKGFAFIYFRANGVGVVHGSGVT